MTLDLAPQDWPDADLQMWDALTRTGGLLDDAGGLAHLKPVSLDKVRRAYGRWLRWLQNAEAASLSESPARRATTARLHAWIDPLDCLSPTTRFMLVRHVIRVLRAADPELDWGPQRRYQAFLRIQAGTGDPARKRGRILDSAVLLEAGLRHARLGPDTATTPLEAAKRRRDGLMIAMLATMPIRVQTFRQLELDRSLFLLPEGIVVALPEEQTKTGAAWEAKVPEPLASLLRQYHAEVRPWLMAQCGERHGFFWVNDRGRQYGKTYLSQKISTLTERLTGVRIPPHFFRDSAATTLARHSPRAAQLIRPVLGHADVRTAERHYNHARTLEAGRDYAMLLARRKKEKT